MSARSRRLEVLVGLVLVAGGTLIAMVKLAPCAFATSRNSTEGILAEAERWLEVAAPVPDVGGSGTVSVELVVRSVGPGGTDTTAFRAQGIAIYDEFLRQLQPALDNGSRVFLAIASAGLVHEEVAYVVSRRTDDTHVFLSSCGIDLTAETRNLLGSRYEPVMRRLVGLTGRDEINGLLAGVQPAPGHVLVEWTRSGPNLRMFSRTGRLVERGPCLAVKTEVGPLVPIWDESYYLAIDPGGSCS